MPSQPTLADYKAPYPAATPEQKRYVVYLPPRADEGDCKVQLIPGRTEQHDGANHFFIGGTVERKTIEGWGYDYLVITLGPTGGTLMGVHGDAAVLRPRFVAMHNDAELLVRYNSKLPIVVYVPSNAELRYRIWQAQGDAAGIEAHVE